MWYAASILLYTKFKHGIQDKYPLWENVVLIEAETDSEAVEKAERIGREGEGDSGGTFTYGDRPATLVFAGVRKLIKCVSPEEQPGDGTEITYSEMEVAREEDLSKVVKGESVTVIYHE